MFVVLDPPGPPPPSRWRAYAHVHALTQSLEPTVLILGNPIAILPAAVVLLVYGFLGSGVRYPRSLRTGYHFPRWFEFFLLCLTVSAPLTYYFHQAAHTPDEQRHPVLTWLQRVGVALSPELHKVHHRRPNGTWSVLVGWMDWLPSMLKSLNMLEDARATLCVIFIVVALPWYGWLLWFLRTGRGTRAQKAAKDIV